MITTYFGSLVIGGDGQTRGRYGAFPRGGARLHRDLLAALLAALLAVPAACAPDAGGPGSPGSGAGVEPRADYAEVAAALSSMIEREREQKGLEAFSIALVDGDDVVWATGFGTQDPERGIPASAETVYRVGSVSKLFTDIAVMQLVERGELDLDAPVGQYLPGFAPENRGGTEITLRQLMSHRSGLIREPPAGHYFDDTGTDLAATVASLNGTPQIYPPTARTKYSNAGIAVVGYALDVTRGEPFADYVRRAVLELIGMTSSAFTPEPEVVNDLARAYMWGFDRGLFDAPTFELGMAPAGSMYSTVLDLSRFMSALFRGGEGENGRILQSETLESMWAPQFAPEGATSGYGLGFAVQERAGQRRLGHGGAIYGFSTQLAFLPESGIGVVAVSAVDGTNTVTGRVADAALELMLAAKAGAPLPEAPLLGTDPIDPALALDLEGVYGEGDDGVELDARGGRLALTPLRGGATLDIRTRGDTLIVDDRLAFGARYLRDGDDLLALGDTPANAPEAEPRRLARRPETGPPPQIPGRWAGLIGEYGWDHNVLYILEREGRLHALIEWFFLYPLEEVSRDVFAFPDWGLYHGERLAFTRDAEGRATAVEAASVRFARREVGTEGGAPSGSIPCARWPSCGPKRWPRRPLPRPGRSGSPNSSRSRRSNPASASMSATRRRTTSCRPCSTTNRASFLQRPAAEAVARAHRALAEHGYGLLLHDGYRPWYVTKMFWDATPESGKIFVADPASGSRHNRGSAIDINLFDLATGEPVDMVGTYDEFSPRSFPNYPGGTSRQRWLRELLRQAMEAEGFTVYEAEWWHFDHDDWRSYAIQNAPFDELGR